MKFRAFLWLLSSAFGWALALSVAAVGLEGNLALYLQFEEKDGEAIKDASPKGNHGKIVGAVKRVDGKFGKGVEFDGMAGNYIEIPNSPSLNPTDQITIAVWLNLAEAGGNRRILQKGTPGSDNQYRLLLEGGGTFFRIHIAGLAPADRIQTAGLFPLNEWHHGVGVFDGKKLRVYLDGKEAVSADTTGQIPVVDGPVFVGTKWQGAPAGDYWKGILDEVAIFNKGLTEAEVKEVMKGPKARAVQSRGKLALRWASLKIR